MTMPAGSPAPFSDELLDARGTFALLVRSVRLEADGIVSLELARPDGGELPGWEPGAHVDLVLPSGKVRQYSLCGDPANRLTYRIAVLREPDGRGGSAEIHDTALVGRELACRPPRNHFALTEAPRYVFVAGGIGVTPILPMIRSVAEAGRPWKLYYGGRSLRSMAFTADILSAVDEEVAEGTAAAGTVTLWPQDERGLLDLAGIIIEADGDTVIYCCGPEGLLHAIESACGGAGRSRLLHVERFTQDTEAAAEVVANAAPVGAFTVVCKRAGVELEVPVDRTLLDVVREAVPTVLSDCEDGYCGTCETRVLEGQPDHRDTVLSDQEKASNQVMMICVGRSRSPVLVLDV
jgi:ferredoxin-NADP reductase